MTISSSDKLSRFSASRVASSSPFCVQSNAFCISDEGPNGLLSVPHASSGHEAMPIFRASATRRRLATAAARDKAGCALRAGAGACATSAGGASTWSAHAFCAASSVSYSSNKSASEPS